MPAPADRTVDSVRAEAESMTGTGAMPAVGGEAVFTEPWQGRAVALAVETVAGTGLAWDDFRLRLVAALEDQPDREYYESWLVALEQLALDLELSADMDLDRHRMAAASYRTSESGPDDLECFPMVCDQARLLALLSELFVRWWPHIRFGPIIEGAVYELRAPHEPRLSMLDGYLTIDFGSWHMHLCIGDQRGLGERPVAPELARRRRCAHAELQRLWVDGAPRTWMFRMFNGDGDQQLTVLLPNPFLDDDQQLLEPPDWGRLACWDGLRAEYLGLPPDPIDRSGEGFVHA